ncbi:unnamed protein product [Kuraishia capsulata CBS 1993]|uniref:Uncharacterized protein n=1 Tax=Kuraishia capsulata CBS 1993 TaxID=1382522 RepID=W6MWZ2_9ASCO|nr:uncharacterized protein KUCA_T00004000001 [Kuraishia capsulata CBS 1993]CDK28020.1 unnamed protein product [Kuraishia capsulata CBS 1993]
MMHMLGNSLYYLSAPSHLYQLNMDDPYNPNITGTLLEFASQVLATVFYNWILYNLLLISAGYRFTLGSKDQRFLWFIRWVTICTVTRGSISAIQDTYFHHQPVVERMLSEMMEMLFVLQYLVCFIPGSYFSVKTYSELCSHGRNSAANRFFATATLILLAILFDLYASANHPQSLLWRIEKSKFVRHFVHLVATLLVAFLWKDTILESEKVLKGE